MADLIGYRGDTFVYSFYVTDPLTGARLNVTGWKFWFTVKRYYADADRCAVYQTNTDDGTGGISITEPASGKLLCTMPALATEGFPDGRVKLIYDIQALDGSNLVRTVDIGTLTIIPDVTRTIPVDPPT